MVCGGIKTFNCGGDLSMSEFGSFQSGINNTFFQK